VVYYYGGPVNFIDPSGYFSESYSLTAGDGSNDYDGATFNTQREADWGTIAFDQNQINSIMNQDRLISNIGMGIIGSAVLVSGAYAYGPAFYASVMTHAAQNPQIVKEGVELVNQALFKGKGKAPSANIPDTIIGRTRYAEKFISKILRELDNNE